MLPQRIAVIGGVAAGPAAAAQAARVAPEAEVVLFEQGAQISYSACETPYFVAGAIERVEDLIVLTPEEFTRTRGPAVRIRHRVLAIDPRRCRIDVRDERTGAVARERFDKVILAVGASARLPDLDGVEAPNVFVLRRLDDAVALRQHLERAVVRHAVILGAGYVGLEVADALRARGIRVTVLQPGGGVLHRYLGTALQSVVGEVIAAQGVTVRGERAMALEHDAAGSVRAVRTDRGELVGCRLVVAAIGLNPSVDLAAAAGITVGRTGALAVDAGMRTNLPNVWACGDCVEVDRVIDRKRIHLPLSTVAFKTARVAGHNAARRGHGAPMRFPGACGASAVRVFGLEIAAVGLRLAEARDAGLDAVGATVRHRSRAGGYPGGAPLHVHLVAERGSGRLLGGELVGAEGAALRADVLVPLLHAGATVEALYDLDLVYTPPVAPSLDPLTVAASAVRKALRSR